VTAAAAAAAAATAAAAAAAAGLSGIPQLAETVGAAVAGRVDTHVLMSLSVLGTLYMGMAQEVNRQQQQQQQLKQQSEYDQQQPSSPYAGWCFGLQ
jgi:hypothetical protein